MNKKAFQALVEKIREHVDARGTLRSPLTHAPVRHAARDAVAGLPGRVENRAMPGALDDRVLDAVSGGALKPGYNVTNF